MPELRPFFWPSQWIKGCSHDSLQPFVLFPLFFYLIFWHPGKKKKKSRKDINHDVVATAHRTDRIDDVDFVGCFLSH